MNKTKLREKLLEKRKKIDKKELIEKGNIIKEKLFELEEYKKAKTVMFFVSFEKEIYTHDIIQKALENKNVVVPKVIDFEIVPCIINDFLELEEGKYRILEPVKVKEINPKDIDLILVPGMGFDKKGHRIGFGKGYYDRFLKNTSALKIGLCRDFEIVDNISNEEWDIPMDMLISEKQVIKIQK